MLVQFETRASGSITMFGDIAVKLLHLMGRRPAMPSAILPEDIPEALQRLRTGIAAAEDAGTDGQVTDAGNEEEGHHVSLRTRAFPLIEMLEAAAEEQVPVMWHDGVTSDDTGQIDQ